MKNQKTRIIILGGGYAGIMAAVRLAGKTKRQGNVHITLVPDGGGERGAAIRVLRGREPVAAFIHGVQRIAPGGLRYEIKSMNGRPAILALTPAGKPFFALFIYGDGQKGQLLHVIAGRKLKGLDKAA